MNPRLRAGLITLVLLVHGFVAAPLPRSISAADMKGPVAREELERWVGILDGLGIQTDRTELADLTLKTARQIIKWRNSMVAPVRPALRTTGTGQGWGLFTYPDTRPRALVIQGKEDDEWRLLYRTLDAEADWRAPLWRHRRLRAPTDTLSRKTDPGDVYTNFVDYASALAFEDFPELTAVEVYFEQTHSTRPGVTPGKTRILHREVRKR